MTEKRIGKPIDDLPEKVKLIIRREVDDGLRCFRIGNFEKRLESLPKPVPKRKKLLSGLSKPRWVLVPALGTGVAGIIILAAFLWFGRARPQSGPERLKTIDAALAGLPGFRTLSISSQIEAEINEAPSPAESAVSHAIASAGRYAVAAGASAVPAGSKLVPRYSLEEKMNILFGDKTIERALLLFKDKFKEV